MTYVRSLLSIVIFYNVNSSQGLIFLHAPRNVIAIYEIENSSTSNRANISFPFSFLVACFIAEYGRLRAL